MRGEGRKAGKPFPGGMGVKPEAFCGRVESRRQNQACPRQLRPGQAFGNPMDGPGWPPGGNGGGGRSPGEGRGGGPMRRRGREREAIPGIDPGKRGPRRWASGTSESLPERRAWSPRRSVGGLSHADRAGRALKGGLSPRRPCPVFSPVQGKARGQAGPCPGGEGPPPGEPPPQDSEARICASSAWQLSSKMRRSALPSPSLGIPPRAAARVS